MVRIALRRIIQSEREVKGNARAVIIPICGKRFVLKLVASNLGFCAVLLQELDGCLWSIQSGSRKLILIEVDM